MDIKKLAEKNSEYIIERRRYFHQYPELSFEEVDTTKTLIAELKSMGIEVTTYEGLHGVVGTIKGGKAGKTVMLRADIDALPVEEHTGLPFESKNKGKMHACGHDAHMSMLLGAAKILSEIKNDLEGDVKLLFQSGEETTYGARLYIEKGCLNGIDAIFGMHIWGTLDAPYINLEKGNRMASCDNFKIIVEGTSAHGSAPHAGNDAIVAAASVVMNIQTIASRHNDPLNPLVVTVGTMKGGQRFNIIANHVEMEGTIRTFSREMRHKMKPLLKKIIDDSADVLGCKINLEYMECLNPIINEDDFLDRVARNAAIKLYGEESLKEMPTLMGSEDFALYMEKVPGYYGFIGARNEKKGIIYHNHNDKFTIDEDSLERGAALYAQFAYDYLIEKNK
ncbi:amidohydrolase [Fusobacterium sp. PH5-44]|uniref:amidohydrolase n=1 Tax=unclassified Fusobacterium TaxID=2648384 RepID=UPI003D23AEE1